MGNPVSVPSTRPNKYRAPTWSWASVDGWINTPFGSCKKTLISVEDVVVKCATEDTTGAVTGGWLDLRGSLKPITLRHGTFESSRNWTVVMDGRLVRSQDESEETTWWELPSVALDTDTLHETAFDENNARERLFFMPCQTGSTPNISTVCLLLRLVDEDQVLFERIGVVSAGEHQNEDKLLAELDEETKARMPCLRYEDGLHTIRII